MDVSVVNVLALYAGILLINTVVAVIMYWISRAELHRDLVLVWGSMLFTFVVQGITSGIAPHSHPVILAGFATIWVANLAYSRLIRDVFEVRMPFRASVIFIVAALSVSVGLHLAGAGFTVMTLPTALAVVFPQVVTTLRAMSSRWPEATPTARALLLASLAVVIHILDYPFLRMVESMAALGFTVGILVVFALSIFAPAVAAEIMTARQAMLEAANREIQMQTRRKSAFLASISHELRTPMNAIKGFTSLVLRREPALTERGKENLQKVGQSADHLLALINDLLDLSKIEAGRMEVEARPFSVKKLIATCCGTVEPLVKAGVGLRFEVSDEVGEVCTDDGKLRHVIDNLLSNAVKFTEEGEIVVRAQVVHDQLFIIVSDTGIGMPAEALDRIFDEFQQVEGARQKHRGTGLGLAITKRYTELLGGTIRVESKVGKGSTFTVQVSAAYKT